MLNHGRLELLRIVGRCRRRRIALGTRDRAVDEAASGQKGSPEKRNVARLAREAALVSVPMLTLVSHLPLIDADRFATRVAILGEHAVETGEAIRPAVTHNVTLTAELQVTFVTGKVFHVPSASLGLGALVRKDDFVAGGTTRLHRLSVMTSAV